MFDIGMAAGISQQIKMALDELEVVHNTVGSIEAYNKDSAESPFRSLDITVAQFSEFPEATSFGQQHDAAHQVLLQTIAEVSAELTAFKENLDQSVKAARTQDQSVEQTLAALGRRTEAGSQSSVADRTFDEARSEHYEALDVEGNDDATGDSGQSGQSEQTGDSEGSQAYPGPLRKTI